MTLRRASLALGVALLLGASYAAAQNSSSSRPNIIPKGTVSTPGLYVSGDRNTGLYQASGAADTLGFVANGAEYARLLNGKFVVQNWTNATLTHLMLNTSTNVLQRVGATSGQFVVSQTGVATGSAPSWYLNESDAAADTRGWELGADGGQLLLRAVDDNASADAAKYVLRATRTSGSRTITSVELGASTTLLSSGAAGTYSAANSGLWVKNAAGTELMRLWASDPNDGNFNSGNLYIGFETGLAQPSNNSTAGYYNHGIGYRALYSITTGDENNCYGYYTCYGITTGDFNIAYGGSALAGTTTGSRNVAIGQRAGMTATPANANVSGSQNTWIGDEAGPSSTTQYSNATAIGASALSTASNQVVLGNSSVTDTQLRGTVTAPTLTTTTGTQTLGGTTVNVTATNIQRNGNAAGLVRTFTATIDPASLAAATTRTDTYTVTGLLTTGGAVSCNIGADPSGTAAQCVPMNMRASATNTLSVTWRNTLDAVTACDVASATWTCSQAQ